MTTIYTRKDTDLPQRRPWDFYPTERSLIWAALCEYAYALPIVAEGAPILDPGAGDGRWGQAAKALYPGSAVHGVEIRCVPRPAGFEGWFRQDFLSFESGIEYGLVCGNPPYGPKVPVPRLDEAGQLKFVKVPLAEMFIRHGFARLAPGGRMIYLLPLQMQAGQDRYENLWVTHPPSFIAVVSVRPSFGLNSKGNRGTNGTDYGLFVWYKSPSGQPAGTPRRWPTELFTYEPERG